jgi:hypothetical protein
MLNQVLDIFTYSSILFISLFIIGYIKTPPTIFISLSFVIKVILALILLYKFGYKKVDKYTELDRRIIVMISIFILVMSFTDLLNSLLNDVKKIINPNTQNEKWF